MWIDKNSRENETVTNDSREHETVTSIGVRQEITCTMGVRRNSSVKKYNALSVPGIKKNYLLEPQIEYSTERNRNLKLTEPVRASPNDS